MKDDDERDLEIIENRKRFVHALRTTQIVQTIGTLRSQDGNRYCAVGLYCHELMGGEGDYSFWSMVRVGDRLGLSPSDIWQIVSWNDSGCTFAEIAERFEEANFKYYKDVRPSKSETHQ